VTRLPPAFLIDSPTLLLVAFFLLRVQSDKIDAHDLIDDILAGAQQATKNATEDIDSRTARFARRQ
jgi:hypothetical protein